MKLEKKVKKKLEDLGIFLLSGFLIGVKQLPDLYCKI